jgi:2-phospho-L-lactate guanylyltransferase (CobY/MobA/RfbA family)
MKTGSSYKMPKPLKMRLASILNPHKRGEWKRAMIQAELYAAETAKQVDKGKKSDN